MTASAAAAIVTFDIVALGALVVVVMATRAGLDRVKCSNLRHVVLPFERSSL